MSEHTETVLILLVRNPPSAPSEPWNAELREAVDGLLAGYEPTLTPSERQKRLRIALRQGRDRLVWMKIKSAYPAGSVAHDS